MDVKKIFPMNTQWRYYRSCISTCCACNGCTWSCSSWGTLTLSRRRCLPMGLINHRFVPLIRARTVQNHVIIGFLEISHVFTRSRRRRGGAAAVRLDKTLFRTAAIHGPYIISGFLRSFYTRWRKSSRERGTWSFIVYLVLFFRRRADSLHRMFQNDVFFLSMAHLSLFVRHWLFSWPIVYISYA